MTAVLENSLYLLALLNPASKILFLASCRPALTKGQNRELAWKSSAAAFIILLFLAAAGHLFLSRILHVELCALQITGGIVVFQIGFLAVREGRFTGKNAGEGNGSFSELSLVPLASPLIAGPGMIAAVITGSARYGFRSTLSSLFIALLINFAMMLFALNINRFLNRLHLLGPLIRLTGLTIAATGVQMLLSGLRNCHL